MKRFYCYFATAGRFGRTVFRKQAARARELAQKGDDFYISRMLLEVAAELEIEASLIDLETSVQSLSNLEGFAGIS